MFEGRPHYLAYGATDQQTLRDLRGLYNGLIVPGTIAAWQRQATGGFVISLSATDESPPYAIDSRFPLFQQGLVSPKQSHTQLAEVFGDDSLVRPTHPVPGDFHDERIKSCAEAWAAFNSKWVRDSTPSFDKYARRLGALSAELNSRDSRPPERILAPYFVADGPSDPWWERSAAFFTRTVEAADGALPVTRVIAATSAAVLGELVETLPAGDYAVWVSGLNEYSASERELGDYRRSLARAQRRGLTLFGLYGGPYSVLMRSQGLIGTSHGVGFGEHRNWEELPSSGAAPARYYVPRIHRFLPLPLAETLWQADVALVACDCAHCQGSSPGAMSYHDLMKHSVYCREQEMAAWDGIDLATASKELSDSFDAFIADVEAAALVSPVKRRATELAQHLATWSSALLDQA